MSERAPVATAAEYSPELVEAATDELQPAVTGKPVAPEPDEDVADASMVNVNVIVKTAENTAVLTVWGRIRVQNRRLNYQGCCGVVAAKIVRLRVIVSFSALLQSGQCNAPSRCRTFCGSFF